MELSPVFQKVDRSTPEDPERQRDRSIELLHSGLEYDLAVLPGIAADTLGELSGVLPTIS
ncbi:hypothetical protein D3C83_28390 [compost metagenome]